ncbi:MAG: hypothetical protein U0U66_07840 [Cytophagaceae bacterium]
MERDIAYIIIVINLLVGVYFFISKKTEVPLFIALFNVLVQTRIVSLENGWADFVNFNYQIDFVFTMEQAYLISNYITIGSTIMQYVYMGFYSSPKVSVLDSDDSFKEFLLSKKNIIFIGLAIFTLFQLFFAGNISDSYGLLSRLGNSSFILLFYLLFHFTNPEKTSIKLMYLSGFLFLAWLTYSAELRFQFLGWMIPVGYFIFRKYSVQMKIVLMIFGLFVILVIFSAARVMRYNDVNNMTAEEWYDESYERLQVTDDINFIDGFMMMYQVYPSMLEHTYGVEHLNVVFRPIPREMWPGKPLAGWFQNYREKYGVEFANIGFSPTIYGVFYAEIGEEGIWIFSCLWGVLLVYVYRKTRQYSSCLSDLLTGVFLAALVPIFRSGDMAGDFAIVLMSYWPILFFVWKYNQYVNEKAAANESK